MIKQIVVALFAFILLALAVIWVMSGGPRAIVTGVKDSFRSAASFGETSESEPGAFRLPWQPVDIFPTPDITQFTGITESDGDDTAATEERLRELEAEYDRLRGEVAKRSVTPPSPYAGKVAIARDHFAAQTSDPRQENIQIITNYGNSEAIDISGWTLQSALSGSNVQIPLAASSLGGGAYASSRITLEPGATAIVLSSFSPVGVSFRENMCTGYLQQTQTFNPPLPEECPPPTTVLPFTEHNLQQYGDACFEVVNSTPTCRTPHSFPDTASPACRALLSNTLSYEGCVRDNNFRSGFYSASWRVYLGSSHELWANSHDAIRLLDAEGRTVSVFMY